MAETTTTTPVAGDAPAEPTEAQLIEKAKENVAKLMEERYGDDDAGEPAEADDAPGEMPAAEFDAQVTRAVALGFSADEAAKIVDSGLLAKIEATLSAQKPVEAPKVEAKEDEGPTAAGNGDAASSKIAELEAKIRALESRVDRVPDAIDDLAIRSGHEAIFGRERWIDPGSREQGNRDRLRVAVDVLRAGYATKGKAVPPDAELVERAVRMEFADELQSSRAAPVVRRQSQMLSRPASRQERELPHGKERAYAGVKEKMREIAARNS